MNFPGGSWDVEYARAVQDAERSVCAAVDGVNRALRVATRDERPALCGALSQLKTVLKEIEALAEHAESGRVVGGGR